MRIILHFILALISFMMYGDAPKRMDTDFMTECFAVAFFSIAFYFITKKSKRQILSHSLLFTIAFAIVFYQFDLDYVLGLVDMTNDTNKLTVFNESVVCKALCMANIALNCFYAGLCVRERIVYRPPTKIYYFKDYRKNLNLICLFLLITYLITVDKHYLINGYAKHYEQGSIATLCMTLLQATIIAFLILRCYEMCREGNRIYHLKSFWKEFKQPLIFGLLVIFLILISGRRTEAVSLMFSLFFALMYVYKGKVPYIRLVLIVLGIAFFFTVLSFYRVSTVGDTQEALQEASNVSSIFPPTRELAFNVVSLHIILTYVPSQIDYNYGITFFPGFLTIIPGAQRLFFSIMDLPIIEQGSALFCTILAKGDLSWGLGTSCIADVYLSFGLIGVVIVFFIWGFYLGYLEKITLAKLASPLLLVLALCTFKELLYISRGSLTHCFNAFTYSLLLVYFNIKSKKIVK